MLFVSSALNAVQVVVVDDPSTRVYGAIMSLVLLASGFLSLRKGPDIYTHDSDTAATDAAERLGKALG